MGMLKTLLTLVMVTVATVGLAAEGRFKIAYATYLGGGGDETIRSMTFGPRGEVYLVGTTSSPDFPTTPGGLQPKLAGNYDAFVVKLVAR